MTRHERLLENYEDAYFALLMEDVAQMEGARLDQLNMELQNDPHAAVPEGLTKRCLKTININKYFSNLVNVTSIFTSKLYRLRLWYLGCRFNFTLISGKKY